MLSGLQLHPLPRLSAVCAGRLCWAQMENSSTSTGDIHGAGIPATGHSAAAPTWVQVHVSPLAGQLHPFPSSGVPAPLSPWC